MLWPIRFADVAATPPRIRVTIVATAALLDFGPVTEGREYWTAGDGQADAATDGGVGDLLSMFRACLLTHPAIGGANFTVTATDQNVITVTLSGGGPGFDFVLHWSHASTTLDPSIFGFTASDTTIGPDATSPNSSRGIWFPDRPQATDTRDRQPYVVAAGVSLSGVQRTARLATPAKHRDLAWTLVPQAKSLIEYSPATEPTGSFESAWNESVSLGRPLRFYPDATARTPTTYGLYLARTLSDPLARSPELVTRWSVSLLLRSATP